MSVWTPFRSWGRVAILKSGARLPWVLPGWARAAVVRRRKRAKSTCWTVIRAAAAGSPADREELARRYLGVVRAYLAARWRGSALRDDLDDAAQEVFVECFRQGGVLEAAGAGRVPNFRAFLYGVVRNVARRFESRPVRAAGPAAGNRGGRREPVPSLRADLGAGDHGRGRPAAAATGRRARPEAVQRVELLRLRFEESLPIRTIAERWGVDPARLHHAYALARQEFRAALLEVVAFHQPGSPAEVEQEAASLLKALS